MCSTTVRRLTLLHRWLAGLDHPSRTGRLYPAPTEITDARLVVVMIHVRAPSATIALPCACDSAETYGTIRRDAAPLPQDKPST